MEVRSPHGHLTFFIPHGPGFDIWNCLKKYFRAPPSRDLDITQLKITPPEISLMTSISQQPPLAPQASTNAAQTATQVHSPSPSISGTTSPLAAVPAPTARSYANATKKPFSPTIASDANTAPLAVGGPAPAQHGQSDSKSSANSNQIPPAVPTVNTPTIVNGNNVISQPAQGDHSRKPSVTISASGATGYIPNGGPVAGPQSRPNSIQFGSMNAGGSPGQGNVTLQNQSPSMLSVAPMNPRISSPQTSPSPIPQPATSGGRPTSSLQGQGNGPIFGSLGGDSGDVGFGRTLLLLMSY